MKLLAIICLLTLQVSVALAEIESPLSATEADAIVAERESAKAERKAARLAELNKAEVLSEGEATLPDGRKVFVREVKPPVLPKVAARATKPTS